MDPPIAVEVGIERIRRPFVFNFEPGWVREIEPIEKLPAYIAPIVTTMAKKVMALRLALRPVTLVVHTDNLRWAANSHQRAQIDERAFEPDFRVPTAVDHQAVHADTVTEQQADIEADKKEDHCHGCGEERGG